MDSTDPAICPLCGSRNMCAMEVAKATGKPLELCWCVNAVFTPELLKALGIPPIQSTFDNVKTEMENCKCNERNMPPSSKTRQSNKLLIKATLLSM